MGIMSRRRKGLSNVKKEKKIEQKVHPKQDSGKADAKVLGRKPKNGVDKQQIDEKIED